jgi:hypothetical protein
MEMCEEQWHNDTDWEKPKYRKKNLSQYHSVTHKVHKDWPRLESGTPR